MPSEDRTPLGGSRTWTIQVCDGALSILSRLSKLTIIIVFLVFLDFHDYSFFYSTNLIYRVLKHWSFGRIVKSDLFKA